MLYRKPILKLCVSVLLSAACGCSPLRYVTSSERSDSLSTTKNVVYVRDTVTKTVNQTITQTVVEYYPVRDTVYIERDLLRNDGTPECPRQLVKSVTRTTVATHSGMEAARDSSVADTSAVHKTTRTVTESEDKPSPASKSVPRTAMWIAVSLMCILLIIIVIKFKK